MAKILVVDDTIFMRKMLSDILVKDGHEVIGEAENAQEAVHAFEKLKPDLVTLDIIMPEVNGVDAMKAIRKMIAFNKKARILMVSAMGQQQFVSESIRAGAKDFIIKPFEPANVKSVVRKLLNQ